MAQRPERAPVSERFSERSSANESLSVWHEYDQQRRTDAEHGGNPMIENKFEIRDFQSPPHPHNNPDHLLSCHRIQDKSQYWLVMMMKNRFCILFWYYQVDEFRKSFIA